MADATTYNLPVFREQGTGKIRIKGSVEIDNVAESPADAAEIAAALNLVLQLLRDLGVNADTDE